MGETATHECITTLSFFAGEFPRFRVGSLVLCQSYRNPALLAKMAANLQLQSSGRFILGLGAGWKEDEHKAYGYPFPDTRTRLQELEEAAIIVKAMWSSRPATYEGKHYSIHEAYCEPHPDPPIPLLIGGGGEKVTLRIAARHANITHTFGDPQTFARKMQVIDNWCAEIGRDPREIERSCGVQRNATDAQRDAYVQAGAAHLILDMGEPWNFKAVENLLNDEDGLHGSRAPAEGAPRSKCCAGPRHASESREPGATRQGASGPWVPAVGPGSSLRSPGTRQVMD